MKKNLLVVSVIAALFIASACNIQSKQPENVAEKFLIHLSKSEYMDAKKLATGNALQSVEVLESFVALSGLDSIDPETPEAPDIKNLTCIVDKNKAKCTYLQNGREGAIELENIKGQWLVSSFPKETSSSGADLQEETPDNLVYNDSAAYLKLNITDTSNIFGFAKINVELSSVYYLYIESCWFAVDLYDVNEKKIGEKQLVRFENIWPNENSDEDIICYGINTMDIREIRMTPLRLFVNEELKDFIPSTLIIADNDYGIRVILQPGYKKAE